MKEKPKQSGVDAAAAAALAQEHQIEDLDNQLSAMNHHAHGMERASTHQKRELDDLHQIITDLWKRSGFAKPTDSDLSDSEIDTRLELNEYDIGAAEESVAGLDFNARFLDASGTWDEYLRNVDAHAKQENIDLARDPFDSILSDQQKFDLYTRIDQDLTLTNDCDKWDYLIGGACGVLAGLMDALLVGTPGDAVLGKKVDQGADELVERFADLCGWKGPNPGSNPTDSAIGFLEGKFRVNYDHRYSPDVGSTFKMHTKNHHLKSLAHSPSPIGLVFSIVDQFTGTASFASEGRLIRIDSESRLIGGNLVSRFFAAFCNWIGHIVSDMAGSPGSKRGSGIPIPFFELFQFVDIDIGDEEKRTIAELSVQTYERGYDSRFGATMAIPVLFNELLIRVLWMFKRRYYHLKTWEECMPSSSHSSLRRMLIVGHGCLCLIDGSHAIVKGSGELVKTLLNVNLVAWTRFAMLGLREAFQLVQKDALRIDLMNERLNNELKILCKESQRL